MVQRSVKRSAVRVRWEFSDTPYVHSTPGMKQSAADAIGNTIRNAI